MEFIFLPTLANSPQCEDVTTEADNVLENTENFEVILSSSDTAVITDLSIATISILDDDSEWKN